MKASSKKRILRMVVLDLLGFCVLAYLVCAQVFHFFPWKPIEIDMTEINIQGSMGNLYGILQLPGPEAPLGQRRTKRPNGSKAIQDMVK